MTDGSTLRAELVGPHIAVNQTAASSASLAGLLRGCGDERLAANRSRLQREHPHKVLQAYQQAFAQGKRELAFLCSEALAALRMPPCFRHSAPHSLARLTDMQSFDLLAHDLQWIAAMYPDHDRKANGGYSGMLRGTSWLSVAEHYWSTKNRGEAWLMVRQLALSDDQQWECAFLRSAPIKLAANGLHIRQATVYRSIMDRLREAKRTARGCYPLEPAYERRFKVWVCGEITGRSPTKVARLYEMWTGSEIARSVAYSDLEWIHAHVPESRKRGRAQKAKRNMQ